MTKHIIPQYKLMLVYDVQSGQMESYYQFIMNEMVPTVQKMGLYIFQVWHTPWAWGDHPVRQAEFVAEDLDTVRDVLNSETWIMLENKLQEYATNYHRKVVRFKPGFQL
jgi:hypothetical protein